MTTNPNPAETSSLAGCVPLTWSTVDGMTHGLAICVIAHDDPDWPDSFAVRLEAGGVLLALGRDPLRAAAKRLLEQGYRPEFVMVLRYADSTRPTEWGSLKEITA